jgi:hypothetical protein
LPGCASQFKQALDNKERLDAKVPALSNQ